MGFKDNTSFNRIVFTHSLAIAAAKEEMADLTPSSVKSSLIEWCHASGPRPGTWSWILALCSLPDTVANPEMFYHLHEASPWGCQRYFSRGVGAIVHRQVIVKNASNNKLQLEPPPRDKTAMLSAPADHDRQPRLFD
jgi:hypothetical protein